MFGMDLSRVPSGICKDCKDINIPVTPKTSHAQCMTITQVSSLPNEDGKEVLLFRGTSSRNLVIQSSVSASSSVGTEDNEMTTFIPKKRQSYMIIKDKADKKDKVEGVSLTKTVGMWGLNKAIGALSLKNLPFVGGCVIMTILIFPYLSILMLIGIGYFAFKTLGVQSTPKRSRRTIKWTVENFAEEIESGFLTCPEFTSKCGTWRLCISQRTGIEGTLLSLGVIACQVGQDVESVEAKIRFILTNSVGQELCPGMSRVNYNYKFERCGDSFKIPKPFLFPNSLEQGGVNIACRIDFKGIQVGFGKILKSWMGWDDKQGRKKRVMVDETGVISQELMINRSTPGPLAQGHDLVMSETDEFVRFVQNPETKTFTWEIPNFASKMFTSDQVWGIFSPMIFMNCDHCCSIWRMKLLEISGVFRLHLQLLGLPKEVKQVQVWYLIQIVDRFGDSVVPEHAAALIKYPEHVNFEQTLRHILHRRERMTFQYVGMDGSLTLRISMQVKPNNVPLLESDSDEWINQK